MNERIKSVVGLKCSICGKDIYAKGLCLAHYQKDYFKRYFATEKGKAFLKRRRENTAAYNLARNNLKRYLSHRLFIYFKFKNKEFNKNRFYQIEAWKQRLQEMDAIFIDQIIRDYQDSNLNLESFISNATKQFAQMDKDIEKDDLTKYERVNWHG